MDVMTALLFKTVKNHATYVLMVSKTTGSLLLIHRHQLHRLLKIKSLMFFNYKIVIWNHAVIGCLLLFVNPFAMLQCVIVVPLVNVAKLAKNANGKYSCIYYIKDECIKLQWFCKRIGKLFWKNILFRCSNHEEYIGRWMIWF